MRIFLKGLIFLTPNGQEVVSQPVILWNLGKIWQIAFPKKLQIVLISINIPGLVFINHYFALLHWGYPGNRTRTPVSVAVIITGFMDLGESKTIHVSALWWLQVKAYLYQIVWFPGVCGFSEKWSYIKPGFTFTLKWFYFKTFCVLKFLQKKLICSLLFSPLSRKLFQSFVVCGIVCALLDTKILRPEIPLDLWVIFLFGYRRIFP